MSVINTQPLIGASGNQGVAEYNLTRSLRFRSSASAYLNRTPASVATSGTTFTYSAWVKRGLLVSSGVTPIFSANNGTNQDGIQFWNNRLDIFFSNGGSFRVTSTAVYRDPSAWYHVVVAVDTTQATAANRVKMYINGVQITAFDNANYPTQNYAFIGFNKQSVANYISVDSGSYFDGYYAELNVTDGQALTPSSFGETSTTTGVWIPKRYAGTYGTNGFYLDFEDTSSVAALGYDAAGSNDWTVNNVSLTSGATYDSMTDVPTLTSATAANYAVLNPLSTNTGASNVFNQGNLQLTSNSGSVNSFAPSTISMTSGKYYFEATAGTVNGSTGMTAGVYKLPILHGTNFFAQTNFRYFSVDGKVYNETASVQNYSTYTNGDVIGVALDLTNGKVFFAKNGTWQGSSDPAAGTNPAASGLTGEWVFGLNVGTTVNDNAFANFGQRPFAYTPPTGFVALNTFNLPTPTIGATASTQANKYMDATLYTGNASARSITNAGGFEPDLVWVKNRTDALTDHKWTDSVRGVTKSLESNTTDAEATDTNGLTAFNSNGFSLGTDSSYNANSKAFVGWQWRASDSAAVSNTDGSQTSTVSVNASAGFSIVTFTATGANVNGTVGHGLGVAPKLVIVKDRGLTSNWAVYHSSVISSVDQFLRLNTTDATVTLSQVWGGTLPTSTVFGIRGDVTTQANDTCVAYCFAEVAGYSKFGSYTGNGSTDGTFVYLGFRPKFVMIKRTDATANWSIRDSVRGSYNVNDFFIRPNSNDEETVADSTFAIDFLSNGFKLRGTWQGQNASGGNLIYAAFAETPFKFANAR